MLLPSTLTFQIICLNGNIAASSSIWHIRNMFQWHRVINGILGRQLLSSFTEKLCPIMPYFFFPSDVTCSLVRMAYHRAVCPFLASIWYWQHIPRQKKHLHLLTFYPNVYLIVYFKWKYFDVFSLFLTCLLMVIFCISNISMTLHLRLFVYRVVNKTCLCRRWLCFSTMLGWVWVFTCEEKIWFWVSIQCRVWEKSCIFLFPL